MCLNNMSFDFITKSTHSDLCSLITDKNTGKCRYINEKKIKFNLLAKPHLAQVIHVYSRNMRHV